MAKDSSQASIFDLFAGFGRDLKLPNVDVEAVIEHHRRNLEALEKSARTASTGASAIMERQREMLRETLAEIAGMAESYRAPGDPQELAARQSEFARRSFETAVRNATEMADLVRGASTDTIEVLRERIRAGMEEIRAGYERKE